MMSYGFNSANLPCFYEKDIKTGEMKVEGYGEVTLKPDVAEVNFSVITEDKSLKSAQRENSKITKEVISALQKEGIDKKDISTLSYSVEQQYDYLEGKQVFRGYKVTNTLKAKIRQLNRVGDIIDAAVEAGANGVYNIKFTISNPSCYYNNALILAVENAVLKAQQIGKALRVCLCKIPHKIEEGNSYNNEGESTFMLKAQATSTPIIPGDVKISARVQTYFSYD